MLKHGGRGWRNVLGHCGLRGCRSVFKYSGWRGCCDFSSLTQFFQFFIERRVRTDDSTCIDVCCVHGFDVLLYMAIYNYYFFNLLMVLQYNQKRDVDVQQWEQPVSVSVRSRM